MNNAVFGKTMKNVRKHGDIEFVTTERRRTYLASQQNYHTAKFCRENLLAIEIKKKQKTPQMLMNKPVYLGLSISDFSKTVIYEFWYNYVKPKYGEKAKLCYMDCLIFHIERDYTYNDIAEDVETRFDTSN